MDEGKRQAMWVAGGVKVVSFCGTGGDNLFPFSPAFPAANAEAEIKSVLMTEIQRRRRGEESANKEPN